MAVCRHPSTSVIFTKLLNPLLVICIIFAILYVGQETLKPFAFSCLMAILLISPCSFFERQGFPRGIATLISLLMALVVFLFVFYFISNSIVSFRNDVPQMVENINGLVQKAELWIQQKFHVSTEKMQAFVQSSTDKILPSTSSIVNTTVTTVTNIFFIGIVVFITTFLVLL